MERKNGERAENGGKGFCPVISLQSIPSHIKTSDNREISFTRAVLTIQNVSSAEAAMVELHATLGQEGGTIQDVTSSLVHAAPASIPAGGSISLDVYDLLLPAHPGIASKIHMFGYRAALNWKFELSAWVEYRTPNSSETLKTPVLRRSLQWSIADTATGAVRLTVEDSKD
jgi:hypothetical protein